VNREMKVVTIVFGSLFALLVIVGIGVAYAISRASAGIAVTEDPAAMRRTAAKIARFDVPRGYRIATATDFGVQQSITLEGAGRRHPSFMIQMQGTTLPSDPKTNAASMRFALGLAARVMRCEPHDTLDEIRANGNDVVFEAMACEGIRSLRMETGSMRVGPHTVTIMATGRDGRFDRDALVALVGSMR
jgi:hypothetical protein